MKPKGSIKVALLIALVVILAGALGYGYYRYHLLTLDHIAALNDNRDLTQELDKAQQTIEGLNQSLNGAASTNYNLNEQVTGITSQLGTLTKLTQTDKELLQKYSKVYFLNENYVPSELATITPDLVYQKDRAQLFHAKALPFLVDMMAAANTAGNPLQVISAYRSFGDQSSLKTEYKLTYGSGANKFSADQGYSEHQLGTAVDLTTVKLGASFEQFSDTQAYQWMQDNAYKYGFILSYPPNNTYYQFEPWHWRFVGKALALTLHNENQNFYDLDQRTIDNYLVNIFD